MKKSLHSICLKLSWLPFIFYIKSNSQLFIKHLVIKKWSNVSDIVTETDLIFYFFIKLMFLILIIRIFAGYKFEYGIIKNTLVIYSTFIFIEKFYRCHDSMLNIFIVAYYSIFLEILCKIIKKNTWYIVPNSAFISSVVFIYLLIIFNFINKLYYWFALIFWDTKNCLIFQFE